MSDRVNRYRIDIGTIIDTKTGDILTLTQVRNKLNTYNNRLSEKDDLLQKQIQVSQNLDKQLAEREKELADIKRTLDDMIDNERTKLGANALMQYREAIQ